MNILFVGLGSIGQRHLRNLKKIYPRSKIFAYRRIFKTPFLNNFNKVKNFDLKSKYKINYIKSLNNLKKYNLKAAFICSPSKFHIDESIKIANQNINLFIEKPLGSNLKNIGKLLKIVKNKRVNTFIGFQLRFSPIIIKLKKILESKNYGDLNQILIHHGEHIKNFHKYEDYKKLYASKKELGGGVILTQIHEIDYFLYLFEKYKILKINKFSEQVSKLEINVDDTLISTILLKKNKKKILCNINLNYYEIPNKRSIILIYENKKITADLVKQQIIYENTNKKRVENYKFKRNDLFIDELKYFFKCLNLNRKVPKSLNIYNGIKTLKFALKLKN